MKLAVITAANASCWLGFIKLEVASWIPVGTRKVLIQAGVLPSVHMVPGGWEGASGAKVMGNVSGPLKLETEAGSRSEGRGDLSLVAYPFLWPSNCWENVLSLSVVIFLVHVFCFRMPV